jgi:hypothetical protein
VLERELGI